MTFAEALDIAPHRTIAIVRAVLGLDDLNETTYSNARKGKPDLKQRKPKETLIREREGQWEILSRVTGEILGKAPSRELARNLRMSIQAKARNERRKAA
jgi:hypothetical protein